MSTIVTDIFKKKKAPKDEQPEGGIQKSDVVEDPAEVQIGSEDDEDAKRRSKGRKRFQRTLGGVGSNSGLNTRGN